MATKRRAFTLVELLTVLFITVILMGLIVVPMVQGFNLVRSAFAFQEAQDRARLVLDRISTEIANSAGVRDNSGYRGALDFVVPGAGNAPVSVRLGYTKLDIVKPAQEGIVAGGGFVNPNTGKVDPTLRAPKGQLVLPVAPGATLVRYWIGLRDPFRPYTNPYDGLLMARSADRDNLYVLYRAEIQPIIFSGGSFVPNQALFDVDAQNQVVLDDPRFFIADGSAAKAQRIRNWLAKATVITEVSRYDMIRPIYDRKSRQVQFDGNLPRIVPLVQFRPSRVSSEPAEGQSALRLGEEFEGMDQLASDVFKTRMAGWANAYVRIWPYNWSPGGAYNEAYSDTFGAMQLFTVEGATTLPTFNISDYMRAVQLGTRYPFSLALNSANLTNPAIRSAFVPFFVDQEAGKVVASFAISEVGTDTAAPADNLPAKDTGSQTSPANAGTLAGSLSSYTGINDLFNKVWQDQPDSRPNIHRFVDLRVTPNADGTPSPLDPDETIGFARATIVPGSEMVVGPDQNPGPNYGNPIRYTRTSGEPGPNQYKINYTNLREPEDYALLGLPNPPATYDADNLVSAVIQPRYKVGYVQLNSDPNVPLPAGNIRVSYRFQFTRPGDTVAVDYDSRRVMSILLTIRNFPQTAEPNPQSVTLKANATVRNYLR